MTKMKLSDKNKIDLDKFIDYLQNAINIYNEILVSNEDAANKDPNIEIDHEKLYKAMNEYLFMEKSKSYLLRDAYFMINNLF